MYVDNNYRYEDFSWKGNKLYCKSKFTKFELIPVKGMFWFKFPDGENSHDFFNKTRAKDNCIKTILSYLNSDRPEDLHMPPGFVKTNNSLPM